MSRPKPTKAELAAAKKWAEAQLGTGSKKQESLLKINETGETETITPDDIKSNATLYLKGCEDCTYTLAATCTKIMIEGCKRTKVIINAKVLTTVLEIWRSDDCILDLNTPIKTLQADLCHTLVINFQSRKDLTDLIWAGVENLKVNFVTTPEINFAASFSDEKKKNKKLSNVDQFYIRDIEGAITQEAVIRLKNGYPSTHRQKAEFDAEKKKNDKAMLETVRGLVDDNPALLGGIDGPTKERLRKKLEAKKEEKAKAEAKAQAEAKKKGKAKPTDKKSEAAKAKEEVEKLMKGFSSTKKKKKGQGKKGAQAKKSGGNSKGKKGGKGK